MAKILRKMKLAPNIFELVVNAPDIASKAKAGHFVIVMADEKGERIPLTIGDSDAKAGSVTLVLMSVGTSSHKISKISEGESLYAIIGPLGNPSEIHNFGTAVMVAGGVGAAPIYPIAKALKACGNKVVTIHGARTNEYLFWKDRLRSVSDEYIVMTDDGSSGRKGLVTLPLKEILEKDKNVGVVYTIGPAIMMKACCEVTHTYGTKTIASLNTIMIDGTGMCGGCRVNVGKETLFTCVDGPEFDGHLVDWDSVLARSKIYVHEEKCSLERYLEKAR